MNIHRNFLLLIMSLVGLLFFSGCGKTTNDTNRTAPGTTVGTEIDDSIITAKVKSKLLADLDIKGFDFKVETHKGDVQLSGFVDSQAQIDHALSTARSVEGVKNVNNKLTLKSASAATSMGTKVDDGMVTSRVKSALLADPDIKSLDIAVTTNNSVVQLSGLVNTQNQIDRAGSITRAIDGVHDVVNELRVKK